jgi:uncharacterized protein YecT (DUF1311 family)
MDCASEIKCILTYLEKSGASKPSIDFVKKMEGEGYLESFQEKGRVDIGTVTFPGRANTNEAYVLLNGIPALVSTELYDSLHIDISRDPNYSKLKKQYPELDVWGASAEFIQEKSNSEGGQNFVFSYYLVNGCHACGISWNALVEFNFSQNGKFNGVKFLKLVTESKQQITEPQATSTPSFNCAKATTNSEKMICSNNELAAADVKMVEAYKAVLHNSPNKNTLKKEQNHWRKNIRDVCVDADCMLKAYQDRISQLSC